MLHLQAESLNTRVLTSSATFWLKARIHILGSNFFSKIERHIGFPHDSNYTSTKMKACFGPRTAVHAKNWPKSDFFVCRNVAHGR